MRELVFITPWPNKNPAHDKITSCISLRACALLRKTSEGNVQITPDPVAPVLRRAFPVIAGPKSGLAVAGVVRCTSSVFRVRAVQLLATLGERESDHVLSRIQVVSRVATVWGRVKDSPGARQGPELAGRGVCQPAVPHGDGFTPDRSSVFSCRPAVPEFPLPQGMRRPKPSPWCPPPVGHRWASAANPINLRIRQ